jgi:mannose-6-phosphate isomerase-like protein (cupin superfamily)
MATQAARWVIGHRVSRIDTEGDYALLHLITPSKTPGPPPHYHEDTTEIFFIIKGEMDVMCDGQWMHLKSGESFVIPRGAVHPFRNDSSQDVEWITAFSPKGFERFFHDFGVPVDQAGAREASVSEEMIGKVVSGCGQYGMIVQLPPPAESTQAVSRSVALA